MTAMELATIRANAFLAAARASLWQARIEARQARKALGVGR